MHTFLQNIALRLSLAFLVGVCALAVPAAAQDIVFEPVEAVYSDSTQTVDIFFRVLENGVTRQVLNREIKGVEIIESKSSEIGLYTPIYRDSLQLKEAGAQDSITLHILADLGNLDQAGAEKYRQLIEELFQTFGGRTSSRILFSTVGEDISAPTALTAANINSVAAQLTTGGRDSDLYRAMFQHIRDMKKYPGKRVFVLLSGGINAPPANSPYYQTQLPYTQSDLFRLASSLDFSFFLFPIALGAQQDAEFLNKLCQLSPAKSDGVSEGDLSKELAALQGKSEVLHSNNIIRFFPGDRKEMGRNRTYKVTWAVTGQEVEITYKERGSATNPLRMDSAGSQWQTFLKHLLIGLAIVMGVLAIFHFGVPGVERQNFRKKYVVKYEPQPNVTRRDPLTNEAFLAGESVVVKCRQMCALSTWEGMNGQCPNYPDCLDFNDPCDGAGAPTVDKRFFSMKGIFRGLNWLWFGMLGGFIGWFLFAGFKLLNLDWYYRLYIYLAGEIGLGDNSSQALRRLDSLADETLLGIAFGAGLCFALSLVEERGQPRKLSWGRILLRTVLGNFVAAIVFVLGFSLQLSGLVETPFLNGLITWAIFGIAIGVVLSVGSSIAMSRAVLGGFLSAGIAFMVFFGLLQLNLDSGLARLIGFVIMGGVLGSLLNTVITALEDFELECLSPSQYRGVNPISKWLKAGLEITIGKELGSYVYVKWDDDTVEQRHAKLSFFNGIVYIEPMAEVMRKGQLLPPGKKVPLRDGDIIQLGRDSITKYKYVEKRKVQSNN